MSETRQTDARFCTTCRTMRDVVETFTDSYYTPHGEQTYTVTVLDCDHDLQSTPVTTGPAPGAPYAGPQAVTSPTHHTGDLLAAAHRAAVLTDPWAGEDDR